MKKLTLFLVATLFSALSFAALNPYAYGLSSSLDGTTLTVNYSLNAPATAVSVVIMDGEEAVKTVTCDGITKGTHSINISTLDLPTSKSLTWKVVVTGNSVASPTLHDESIRFYLPYGMDVDVDPESDYMGNWYVIEARNDAKGKAGKENYQSYNVGRALYAFDAALQPKKNKNGQYGFTGGVYLGASQATHSGTTSIVNLYRVVTSGGRVFIGRFEPNYAPIVEADPANLDADFTDVLAPGKRVSSIDARGRGENLQLIMLDTDGSITEYDLGNESTWADPTTPSRTFDLRDLSVLQDDPDADAPELDIVRNDASITYDLEGGIWLNQHRSSATATCPTIAHISSDNGFDYNNISGGIAHNNTNNSGIAVSPDGKKLAVVGAGSKKLTIYNISRVDGQIKLTQAHVITVSAGDNHTALAWDYAGNLFAANRSSERIRIFAIPYSGTVSTPCASKYAFEVEEVVANVYTLTTNVVGEGTIEGNEGSYIEGTTATLTATPAEHYDFLNWTYGSETSTDNPLTITVNSDLTVTANFQEHTKYTITANAADNTMGYVTGGGTYYAGETVTLKAVANSTYYFVNWSDGSTDATRTITVTGDLTLTANFAKATPRAWAYNLKMVEDGDKYKFSFTATSAANATLLFLDKEGNELYAPHNMGAVAAGANTVSIEKAYFTQVKDVYWSVKMDGEAITSVAEITDQSRNIYDFYNMQGVVVDNDPNSEKFGEIYIEMAKSGTTNGKAQTLGLFLLNQNLEVLNTDPNVGIQPTMPSGYALNGTNYTFQRLNIHPKTGDLVFSYGISSKPAVFAIDRENITGSVTNLLDGITAGLTKTVAHCFDAEGTLYVMDLPGSGTIYKIKDGAKSTFAAANSKYVASNITMASDGRGGLWVAQNRGQIDSYYQLAHYNALGTVDFAVYQGSENGFTGYSTRGALAYDAERQILAQGRNNAVEVFSVAYDATTGVPSLTKIATTPIATAANIDGIAFDYAGDLYVVNSGNEKFNKYTLPTAENICTVPAPESQAIIKEVRYTITVNTVGNGSATGAGEYVAGETATLEASPAAHHKFVNWTYGSETSTDNPLEIVVNSDITVTANFEEILYTLIAPTNDENKGTVTGAGAYNYGTEVTLEATAKEGYKLLYWSDRSTENPRTITMTKNEAISAYFVKDYAEEPTFKIEKMWENTNVPTVNTNGYQAVGWDGQVYLQASADSKIKVYSKDKDAATEYAASGAGYQIAVDEAGNLIVFNAYFASATPNAILIYPKGSTTGKAVTFTLPQPGRCDFFSASGDIYSAEGGYVYFYCNTKTVVNRVKITNGAATAADIATDVVGEGLVAGCSQNHVIVDIFGNLVAHSRLNGIGAINIHTNESRTFTLPEHKKNTLGGCSFELGGKEFWAYNVGSKAYTSEWKLYNMTDDKFLSTEVLYAKSNEEINKNQAANWLNVQVVDENTAYIYQYCPTVAVAVWKVSINRTDLQEFTVTASANDPTMGTVTGGDTYYEEATATLTATPHAGYRFVNWTKAGVEVSTDATYSFTVTEDVELVANFEAIQYTLIAPTNDENKGTVSGAGAYNYGTEVTLTANPAAGYKLLYWSDRSTENPRTITMTKNEAISAYFVKDYAEEPTFKIEKMWENTQISGSADGYQAVGWNGKIYMQNKTAGKIKVYSNGTDAAVDYATSNTSGQQIAVDEAGNLIVFNAYFATATPSAIQIYKNGSTTGTAISFTLPHPERCDFISASGDIYSAEGGYVYFYCEDKYAVNRVKITNGELASVDAIGNTANPATSVSHVMVDIFGNLAAHCRSTAVYAINSYTGETTAFNTSLSGIKLSTLGGCSFELGGKEFWAYNVGTTHYNSEWNLYNMTDKVFMSNETLYAKDKVSKKNTGPANWLNVQVVDENTAYIYQFCPEVAVAMWKVSINRTDLQKFTVTATANDPAMGTVIGSDIYYENATATLTATANAGYRFVNWTKAGVEVSTNATYTFTVTEDIELVANFEALPEITYELNGGVWNKYGWTSKKDMYNALLDDWRAYSGSTRTNVSYDAQLGVGNSSKGIPTTITSVDDRVAFWNLFADATYAPKWGWLATYVDAVAATQYKKMDVDQGVKTQPTSAAGVFTFTIGNFFGEDNAHSTDYIDAVDFTGEEAHITVFAPYWGQTFPMPTQPTEEVTLNNPYKEGYLFDGWYATSDFSGAEVTVVDENTNGTLYAKWLEHFYTRNNVTNGNFGTICLPYGSNNMTGAEFYEVVGKETGKVYLDQVTTLEAGKPYIFRATANTIKVIYEGNEPLPAGNDNGLYGTFNDNTTVEEGNYIVYNNELRLCGTGCYINAYRAYLKLNEVSSGVPAPMPGRQRIGMNVQGGNETTALDNITEGNGTITPTMEGTYDVLGRKLTQPTTTGVYIINGKKVFVVK